METPEETCEAPPDQEQRGALPPPPIFRVDFTPMPNWLLRELIWLSKPEIQVIIVLFLQKYETLPWGGPLLVRDFAPRAGLSERQAVRALKRLKRAGWVHEREPGHYVIGPEGEDE